MNSLFWKFFVAFWLGLAQQVAQPGIEALIGGFDTVLDRCQLATGEKLLAITNQDIGPALSFPIGAKVVGVHPLVGLLVIAVPPQDMASSATDEQVSQQGRQPTFTAFH